jgi:hypothetical protein
MWGPMANLHPKKFTKAQLNALELPDDLCNCVSEVTRDSDDVRTWGRGCIHRQHYSPPNWTQKQWLQLFESMFGSMEADDDGKQFLTKWSAALMEAFGEDHEERAEIGDPRESLTKEERVEILEERERTGKSLWNPRDVMGLPTVAAEATGKKKQRGGDTLFKGTRL